MCVFGGGEVGMHILSLEEDQILQKTDWLKGCMVCVCVCVWGGGGGGGGGGVIWNSNTPPPIVHST